MNGPAAATVLPPARPLLAWRVGVTGHRAIPEAKIDAVRSAIAEVLALVRSTLSELAAEPAVAAAYATAPGPVLRVLSPLAEGADRLVAEEALRLGYHLEVALPFPQAEYEHDFDADSVAAFRTLLEKARDSHGILHATVLDGSQSDARQRSYEAVGRFVVRNCDLLIAVYDRQHAARRGGTEDVVRAAAAAGVPIWWIDPTRPDAPRLVDGESQLFGTAPAPEVPAVRQALARGMRLAVVPSEVRPPPAHGLMQRLVHRAAGILGGHATPLQDYLREAPAGPTRMRGIYTRFMRVVAGEPPGAQPKAPVPEGEVEAWWERYHATAAELSKTYGDRYRSSYVLVFFLAGLALLAAVMAFVVPPALHVPVAFVELLTLFGIAVLVGANHRRRWQERWITYRLLAELCRKQRVLAPLGGTLPVRDIARVVATRAEHHAHGDADPEAPPRDAWVAWYFTAMRRAGPLPTGALAGPALDRARVVGRGVFEAQQAYHHRRQQRSEAASRRLAHWGEGFFLLALIGVAVRIALELLHASPAVVTFIGLACAASPAVSATLLGIRAYAEFELLARQSDRMQQVMVDALRELNALSLSGPLASEELSSALLGVTTAMLLDIDGWAQLFHVKALEAG